MTPALRNYILRNLGPSSLRLELVNRLENLCALSGTPMSPDLHKWVERTFGLDMVRVIEGYSTFMAPVLSPSTLDTVDRVVPKNYQGNDVNIEFRRLFDVMCGPPPQICYWYLDLWAFPDLRFDNWQINGQPFNTEIYNITGNASNSVNSIIPIIEDERYVWIIDEQTNLPSLPIFTDSFGNPHQFNWIQATCSPYRVSTTIPQGEPVTTFTPGLYTNSPGYLSSLTFGFDVDLSNPGMVSALDNYYKSVYGNSCYINIIDDGVGNYNVTIENVYSDNYINWATNLGGYTFY